MRKTFNYPREGLNGARLLMVFSSLAPLFVIWAIRGNCLIPDKYFITACASFVFLPYAYLWYRIYTARKEKDKRHLTAGTAEDHRSHVLVYLFAMLLPFYQEEIETYRELAAMIVALLFIAILFWRLNLHYMNVIFAFLNYQIFTVSPPKDNNPHTGKENYVLITRRRVVLSGDQIFAYRLSDTVYLESEV